jgi:hypothetical protein
MAQPSAREWHFFLGTRDADSALTELTRMVHLLDEAQNNVGYILRLVSGSPSADAEEMLRVARTAVHEAIESLEEVVHVMRHDDHSVA